MKRAALLTLAGLLAVSASAVAADMTLFSSRTDTPILLDGKAEKSWDNAQAITVTVDELPYEPNNGYEGMTETKVTMKAMHDADNVYFLITYKDPTKSLERFPWVKQKDGSWKKFSSKDSTGHENTYYEDKFAVFWDINTKGFAADGCMIACHLDLPGDKSAGRKFTENEGETIDMWHSKGVRSMPLGMFDDQYVDSVQDPKKNKNWGRHGDSKKGGGYYNNDNKDKSEPAFMNLGGTEGDKYFVIPSKAVPFVDTFKPGDVVPGIVITPFSGSRGDILSRGNWDNGVWTLEVQRSLMTTGDNAETQDVQFKDLKVAYPFGIAVFDNSQINHLYHEGVLELKFKQ